MPSIAGTDLPVVHDVKTIADVLIVCEDTVLAEIKRGRLAAIKVGRSWRITDAALHAYLAGE